MTVNDLPFQDRLDFAARDFYVKQGLDPDEHEYYNNGTLAYTTRARWISKRDYLLSEIQIHRLIQDFDLLRED
jgi:hypothetical protein